MLFAIGVAAQAGLAGGAGWIAVARMAALASLVLWLRMQTWQLARLMATAARGRLGDAARAVRSVTRQAPGRDVAVRAPTLVSVAGSAGFFGGRAGVRLVAARARLMSFGRALLLGFVAGLAALRLRAGMRLMAALANRMTGEHLSSLDGVAAVTACLQRRWSMGQAAMAALTSLMSRVGADQLDGFGVAALAGPML